MLNRSEVNKVLDLEPSDKKLSTILKEVEFLKKINKNKLSMDYKRNIVFIKAYIILKHHNIFYDTLNFKILS